MKRILTLSSLLLILSCQSFRPQKNGMLKNVKRVFTTFKNTASFKPQKYRVHYNQYRRFHSRYKCNSFKQNQWQKNYFNNQKVPIRVYLSTVVGLSTHQIRQPKLSDYPSDVHDIEVVNREFQRKNRWDHLRISTWKERSTPIEGKAVAAYPKEVERVERGNMGILQGNKEKEKKYIGSYKNDLCVMMLLHDKKSKTTLLAKIPYGSTLGDLEKHLQGVSTDATIHIIGKFDGNLGLTTQVATTLQVLDELLANYSNVDYHYGEFRNVGMDREKGEIVYPIKTK